MFLYYQDKESPARGLRPRAPFAAFPCLSACRWPPARRRNGALSRRPWVASQLRKTCVLRNCLRSLRSLQQLRKTERFAQLLAVFRGTPRTSRLFSVPPLTAAAESVILKAPRGAMLLHPRVKPAGDVSPQDCGVFDKLPVSMPSLACVGGGGFIIAQRRTVCQRPFAAFLRRFSGFFSLFHRFSRLFSTFRPFAPICCAFGQACICPVALQVCAPSVRQPWHTAV